MTGSREHRRLLLGIEGGGTRSTALLADETAKALARLEGGPANVKLQKDSALLGLLRGFARRLPRPDSIAIGLAGAWKAEERERVCAIAGRVWNGVPCLTTSDLETALSAADPLACPQILVVCGTGSCCYGRDARGREFKAGGWGHILGDKGSGFEIGLRALKASAFRFDQEQKWPPLGRRLLRFLHLNNAEDLINWAQSAAKADMASLAPEVFAAWHAGDRLAGAIIEGAAAHLADSAVACARRITPDTRPVQFVLAGSVLLRQPRFAALLRRSIGRVRPRATVVPLRRESVWGAVELARRGLAPASRTPANIAERTVSPSARVGHEDADWIRSQIRSTRTSPTEERNPRSMALDKMPVGAAVQLMLDEESSVTGKLRTQESQIVKGVRAIARAIRRGGRLFYVGAGTSGRLGVLDASECPPTFSSPSEQVQGIIAGGQSALWRAVEGAEDDAGAGRQAIESRTVRARDAVVGLATSGTTPFVWSALIEAKRRGATTILLRFNPYVHVPKRLEPTITIAPNLGPEVLTGSTRLKAGTATKLVLNIFSTLAMVQTGKVISNLMVDMQPSNAKLRNRAARIVDDLTGVGLEAARRALERSQWRIKGAVSLLQRKRAIEPRGIFRSGKVS